MHLLAHGCRNFDLAAFLQELQCEIFEVDLNELNIQLVTAYRSPAGNFNSFLEILSSVFVTLNENKGQIFNGYCDVQFLMEISPKQFSSSISLNPMISLKQLR